jgi:hypothetical protein
VYHQHSGDNRDIGCVGQVPLRIADCRHRRVAGRLSAAPLGRRDYHLEQDPGLLLIIPDPQRDGLRWVQMRGSAQPVLATDWAERLSDVRIEERYVAMRVTPQRIDLVDESQGWGVCETLDI